MKNTAKELILKISISVCLSAMLVHCGDQKMGPLVFSPTSYKGLTVWRSGKTALTFRSDWELGKFAKQYEQNTLVMVTLVEGGGLAAELARDSYTIVFQAPSGNEPGYALMALPKEAGTSDRLLDDLAAAAHRSQKERPDLPGIACGRVEVLHLTPWLTSSGFIPALYTESVAIPTVATLLGETKVSNLATSISTLEAMNTREHSTPTGLQATAKTKELFQAAFAGSNLKVEYKEEDHSGYYNTAQKSLIVSLPGTDAAAPTVILGAHLDSINENGREFAAPGADDNASGIATLVEIARVIAANNLHFTRRLEFHSYAAEEKGLIGSGDIAEKYAAGTRSVAAMFQIDMNAYSHNDGDMTVYLVENDTSPTLRRSLKDLLNTYLGGQFLELSLKAGTSDHRSWTRSGYSAVFPFEHPINYNHSLHTENDTSATINNLPLSERFAKLGLAFAAHYAGLNSVKDFYETTYPTHKASLDSDLKLAIVATEVEGLYDLGVGTTTTVEAIELCTITAAGKMACNQERIHATADHEASDRRLFKTSSIALAADQRLAVFGYDAKDKLASVRTIKLQENNP